VIFVAGSRPQDASTSREPGDFVEGSRDDMSASTAADAAMLDVLYGDLPSYQPTSAERPEAGGAAVPEISSLPITSTSEVPTILPSAELRVITSSTSPTLVIEPAAHEVVASPSSAVAGVLIEITPREGVNRCWLI